MQRENSSPKIILYHDIYYRCFESALQSDKKDLIVYYAIKWLSSFDCVLNENVSQMHLVELILIEQMRKLTYKRFIQLFPINKEYNKISKENILDFKNYDTTMEYLNDLRLLDISMDTNIICPEELLSEYANDDIYYYLVNLCTAYTISIDLKVEIPIVMRYEHNAAVVVYANGERRESTLISGAYRVLNKKP